MGHAVREPELVSGLQPMIYQVLSIIKGYIYINYNPLRSPVLHVPCKRRKLPDCFHMLEIKNGIALISSVGGSSPFTLTRGHCAAWVAEVRNRCLEDGSHSEGEGLKWEHPTSYMANHILPGHKIHRFYPILNLGLLHKYEWLGAVGTT